MKTKLRNLNRQHGFTIIEVMIVLAIAGLILAVILLAVPALQRSQRNNARRSDATHIAGLVGDYVSNHGGTVPSNGAFTTTGENCSQLVGASGNTCSVTVASNGTTWGTTSTAVVQTGQSCNPATNGLSAQAGAIAITFAIESPGGTTNICLPS